MQTNLSKPQTLDYTVSLDILLDVLKIILQNNIPHKLKAVFENDNSLALQISFDPAAKFHGPAKCNIETLIEDHRYFLHGSQAD